MTPIGSLTDLLVSILERGIVFAVRLDGPAGDRRLLVGAGLADMADPMLMALCATGAFGRRRGWLHDDEPRTTDTDVHEPAERDTPDPFDFDSDWDE